jgi:hypothetical protein
MGFSPGKTSLRGIALSKGNVFRQGRENVDVIVHSADFDGMALKVLQYTCHVRVGLTPNLLRTQERPPIFCREDSMHNQV